MKLRLVCVGKVSGPCLKEEIDEYASRIKRYVSFSTVELKEEKGSVKKDSHFIREGEGKRILEKIPARAFVIVLDERGETLSSEEFADLVGKHMLQGTPELVLVVGGAYGLSESVKKRGDLLLSLSSMTFTHQMVRLFLLEQIYRGFTILRNEPYHNR